MDEQTRRRHCPVSTTKTRATPSAHSAVLMALLHKVTGKACLYFKRVSDLDLAVLEALVATSVAELRSLSARC